MKSISLVLLSIGLVCGHPQGGFLPDNAIRSPVGLDFQYRYQPQPGEFGFPSQEGPLPGNDVILAKNQESAEGTRALAELLRGVNAGDFKALIGTDVAGFGQEGAEATAKLPDFLSGLATYLDAHSASIINVANAAQKANLPINTIGGSYIGLN
ncbi:hypothetical protein TCAL_09379 [Tigriopus californicus]|uniref:Uncharacterized protein n=1 Tax=Tigriopus californicus TaxID=6832 RepID=A0A553PSQ2_TIGCA|nr:uncharacterized protein LOC131892138 [Tigriopus californicus]TRY80706.1 hypothetical protein TCAL_09379 [Tigriopus californicus]|eukprot:TCALIF_09379-PA protein Name:"Protein of unknown function" AED:0.14 eAED:0.14 QI:32/0.66/0.75/0.75/1/1/4/0/153